MRGAFHEQLFAQPCLPTDQFDVTTYVPSRVPRKLSSSPSTGISSPLLRTPTRPIAKVKLHEHNRVCVRAFDVTAYVALRVPHKLSFALAITGIASPLLHTPTRPI